jgi:isopentenyl diphosphate isomerase/L-lactate dehydrogenase-like FMN-dependent dehydrogenase
MGGVGTGSAFGENLEALAKRRLNMKTIHDVKTADTSFPLWGDTLAMPVLGAPLTGVSYNMGGQISESEFSEMLIDGALLAGTIGMIGDGADPEMFNGGIAAIANHMGKGIPIIKPRNQNEVIKRIRQAEEAGAIAVGIDIDGAGLVTMAMKGQPVGPKTLRELSEIIKATRLPFILKGIMTPVEADLAVEAGAAAIVVSNHGGRVLDYTPGVADVLSKIADHVRGKVVIFADGGVRSGTDVLKLLSLGADGVLVGRPLAIGAFGGGGDGVAFLLRKMMNELVQAMLLTGTADIKNVNRDIIYQY